MLCTRIGDFARPLPLDQRTLKGAGTGDGRSRKFGFISIWSETDRRPHDVLGQERRWRTRTLSRSVLFVHVDSVGIVVKITALHYAQVIFGRW